MRAAAAAVCLLLAACGRAADGGPSGPETPQPPALSGSMLLGADVSALARIEQAGGVFRDSGKAKDALLILRGHGANLFRLRIFVAPNGQDVQVNDLAYTVALARRVKAGGAKLLLDFHYSDTWADPGHQDIPGAWQGLGSDSLERRVERYSANAIAQLKAAGALPDIVQIGNEIDGGILWPAGRVSGPGYDTPAQWAQFARLLQAGIRGVRGALAPGDSVRIMLHYSQGGSVGGTRWFFDHLAGAGVPYDIIGLSYYPFWHGTLADLSANLQATAARYGHDIMVVETTYPWRAGGWEDMATNRLAMTWATSVAGQAQFARDLVSAVAQTPGGRGLGVVWWYPEAILVPGLFVWGGGSLALFDATGNLVPAAGVLLGK
ncbi:MAG TPA: glycosyl hydrolase 53 family protein [Longimicrobiales bacterium]